MIYLSDQSMKKKAAKNGDHSPGLITYRPSVFFGVFRWSVEEVWDPKIGAFPQVYFAKCSLVDGSGLLVLRSKHF